MFQKLLEQIAGELSAQSIPQKWLAEFDASLGGNYLAMFKKIQDSLND